MYTLEKKIKALKVKNVVCIVIGLFLIITSVSILADLISFYHDQLLTVVTAKATPECILDIIIGTILLVTSSVSRKRIGDANFYSGYFEMDLDGFISYKEFIVKFCPSHIKLYIGVILTISSKLYVSTD